MSVEPDNVLNQQMTREATDQARESRKRKGIRNSSPKTDEEAVKRDSRKSGYSDCASSRNQQAANKSIGT